MKIKIFGKEVNRGQFIFACLWMLFMVLCFIDARRYGEMARLFPMVALIPGLIFGVINLYFTIFGKAKPKKPGKAEKAPVDTIKVLILIGFFVFMIVTTWLIGIALAMALSVFLYMTFLSKEKVWLSALHGAAVWTIIYWGFDIFLRLGLDNGILGELIFG